MTSTLKRATEAYLARDFEAALKLYLDALAELAGSPLSALPLAGAGNCYELLGRNGRAIGLWRQALRLLHEGTQAMTPLAHQLQGVLDAYDRHPMAFISYAHVDDRLVHEFVRHLRRLGCRIRADFDAFVPGRDVKEEIHRVMDECPSFVIAWSSAYRERPYTMLELELIRGLTAREGRSALLVALDDTPYPPELEHLLMMRAGDRSLRELAQEVRRALGGMPLREPPAPRSLRRAARRVSAWSLRVAGTVLAPLATMF